MREEEKIDQFIDSKGFYYAFGREDVIRLIKEYFQKNDGWIAYDWNNLESRPKETGKYFVHRKDGKVHWETWNGSGWAYNGNVITHYKKVNPPTLNLTP